MKYVFDINLTLRKFSTYKNIMGRTLTRCEKIEAIRPWSTNLTFHWLYWMGTCYWFLSISRTHKQSYFSSYYNFKALRIASWKQWLVLYYWGAWTSSMNPHSIKSLVQKKKKSIWIEITIKDHHSIIRKQRRQNHFK